MGDDTWVLPQAKAARHTALPPSLAPRGLSRVQAAEYIGVSTSKFDEMVADGRMPRAKRVDARVIWDRMQLDAAFMALPGGDDDLNPLDALI